MTLLLGISAEALLGNISLLCWMVVLLPQLYENYSRKSCDGLSMGLVMFWLAGDVFNFLGSYLQGLQFSVVALAAYYIVMDTLLMMQSLYYSNSAAEAVGGGGDAAQAPSAGSQSQVNVEDCADEGGRLLEVTPSQSESGQSSTESTVSNEPKTVSRSQFIRRLFIAIVVCSFIVISIIYAPRWFSSSTPPHSKPQPEQPADDIKVLPQVLGWISTFLYFASRVPQILLNYREQSCEGLSPWMFIYMVFGNVTYAGAIFLHSTEWNHIAKNLPWIIGSVGTLVVDCIIFAQFLMYRRPSIQLPSPASSP
ncbi:PQ-loop-domain-containing protein [Ramicandelaber brevisporus]|nr:PQ-loop-domain-containing protein [Ramicandelaber brevisporus]